MKALRIAFIALACIALGFGAFAATRAAQSVATPASADPAMDTFLTWLGATADQRQELRQRDLSFTADLKQLREGIAQKRSALAAALEDPASSDERITTYVEDVIQADAALERRTVKYLLAVRDRLTSQQKQQLFHLCARGVREGPGCWRGGQGFGPGGGKGLGAGGVGQGFGPGGGQGPGSGGRRGLGWRGGDEPEN